MTGTTRAPRSRGLLSGTLLVLLGLWGGCSPSSARTSASASLPTTPGPTTPAGSGTTQPLVYGRYARENPPGPAAPPPGPGDRPVAGETPYER